MRACCTCSDTSIHTAPALLALHLRPLERYPSGVLRRTTTPLSLSCQSTRSEPLARFSHSATHSSVLAAHLIAPPLTHLPSTRTGAHTSCPSHAGSSQSCSRALPRRALRRRRRSARTPASARSTATRTRSTSTTSTAKMGTRMPTARSAHWARTATTAARGTTCRPRHLCPRRRPRRRGPRRRRPRRPRRRRPRRHP